jgi:hypothetical protein
MNEREVYDSGGGGSRSEHNEGRNDGGLENKNSDDSIGQISSTYAGTELEVSNPLKLLDTSAKLSLGEIVEKKTGNTATKICVEFSLGMSTPEPDSAISKIKEVWSKIVNALDKVNIDTNFNEPANDNLSLAVKISGEINTMPSSKSVEASLKVETNSPGVSPDVDFDYGAGDKIGIGGKISVEGCMSVRNRDRNSWEIINKW